MRSRADRDAAAPTVEDRAAVRMNRGITATWWYTASAIIFLEAMIVLVWLVTLMDAGLAGGRVLTMAIGGLVWLVSTLPLLFAYRHRTDAAARPTRWSSLWPIIVAAMFGVTAVALTGSWLLGLAPLAQSLMLLDWPRGVRLRAVIAVIILLGCAWFIDARGAFGDDGVLGGAMSWGLMGFYSTSLPAMTVASLWWWDVLVALDSARASAARLAATQERLRVATDVHDLQGHHLQVIALHLELTEKLLARDPHVALQTLRTARRASTRLAREREIWRCDFDPSRCAMRSRMRVTCWSPPVSPPTPRSARRSIWPPRRCSVPSSERRRRMCCVTVAVGAPVSRSHGLGPIGSTRSRTMSPPRVSAPETARAFRGSNAVWPRQGGISECGARGRASRSS